MDKKEFPILEFDLSSKPITQPRAYSVTDRKDIRRCVITYFQDVVDRYERTYAVNQVFILRTEGIRPRVYEMKVNGETIYVLPVSNGAPQAARMVECMAALGVNKFMVCGGAGTLNDPLTQDKTMIPVSAVRDEGTSYHYLPAAREVALNTSVLRKIEQALTEINEPFVKIKTWTTDGFFRETKDRAAFRRDVDGCSCVEMECAAYYAVAEHKRLLLGQILYAGDIVRNEGWEYRNWHNNLEKRTKLFDLAVRCLMRI